MASLSIKLKGFQQAKAELQKELNKLKPDRKITVGFHVSEGAARDHTKGAQEILDEKQRKKEERLKKRGKTDTKPGRKLGSSRGLTIVEVARYNHYGTARIPARPFLDVSITEKQVEIADTLRRNLERGLTPDVSLERAGLQAVGIVQSYMTKLKSPPNAPSTIKAKRSSNPLIDTGLMRSAVTYKVHSK